MVERDQMQRLSGGVTGLCGSLVFVDALHVVYNGRRLLWFAGCDYFRMSQHPEVRAAIRNCLEQHGLSVSASRVTTGDHRLYSVLEREIARYAGTEAAVLAPTGYVANLMAAQALAGKVTHAFIDERAHWSLRDASVLLGCPLTTFRHRDASDLRSKLERLPSQSKPVVLTDGVFAKDGSIAPLAEELGLVSRRGWLLVDDAHGFGVVGNLGRGSAEWAGIKSGRLIQTVSLSKAVGVFGGAVLTTQLMEKSIRSRSTVYAGSTPMPLPLVAGALVSMKFLRMDRFRRQRLASNTKIVKSALRAAGILVPDTPVPIVSVVAVGGMNDIRRFHDHLVRHAIYPSVARYPGTRECGRFRFVISSEHRAEHLERLIEALTSFAGLAGGV
ncbi:MAG: aminotransferase class I/II-fold pyridoxal phosphate-dependent enzyme [Verrucomicrobiae bacterium]|nr:aminotransferase class I/II-fold pyridoxal phosphate-dependent enzyme [Verrucomicrobiae bacterium]